MYLTDKSNLDSYDYEYIGTECFSSKQTDDYIEDTLPNIFYIIY